VIPQCPTQRRWSNANWRRPAPEGSENSPETLKAVIELLDKLVAELPVDHDRIYITGISMGGYGTWDTIARRPEYFAAAIPICGGGDPAAAVKFKSLPIWAFHGAEDKTVQPSRTIEMVEALRKAGGTPKFTLYPGVGHDCWTQTYANPEVFAWLFEQRKGGTK
jgi:predicted peptidase